MSSDEREKLIQRAQREFGVGREDAKKRLIKAGKLTSSGALPSSSSRSSSDSSTLNAVKTECARVVGKSEHFKEGFKSALIAAMTNIMRNNQDQLFFETANLVTNTPPGSVIPKDQLINNLTQFTFGDDKGRVKKSAVRDAGKFKHVIYLTIITHKKLLTSRTQETTFKKIKRFAGVSGPSIISAISNLKASIKCKSVKVPRKGAVKEVLLPKKTERVCTQEQWARIYLTFSETALKRAVVKLVFGEEEEA